MRDAKAGPALEGECDGLGIQLFYFCLNNKLYKKKIKNMEKLLKHLFKKTNLKGQIFVLGPIIILSRQAVKQRFK